MRNQLAVIMLAAGLAVSALATAGDITPSSVPEKKRTQLNNYLSAKETPAFIASQGKKVLFIDVRTPQELQFVGYAQGIDANIPVVNFRYDTWNDRKGDFENQINPDFVSSVEALMMERNLGENTAIVFMCRSGDRSSKAANLMAEAGYKNVYSVVDGFEGDLAKDGPNAGRRVVNGWKNAGLDWGYKLGKPLFQVTMQNGEQAAKN